MKLLFESKTFSWKGEYRFFDENGNIKYIAKGLSGWYHNFVLFDKFENELMHVASRTFTLCDKYDMYINGKYITDIIQKMTFARLKMDAGNLGWHIESNIMGTEVLITCGDVMIAKINRKNFSFKDKCEVEIFNPQNELLVAGLVIAIQSHYQKAAAASTAAT